MKTTERLNYERATHHRDAGCARNDLGNPSLMTITGMVPRSLIAPLLLSAWKTISCLPSAKEVVSIRDPTWRIQPWHCVPESSNPALGDRRELQREAARSSRRRNLCGPARRFTSVASGLHLAARAGRHMPLHQVLNQAVPAERLKPPIVEIGVNFDWVCFIAFLRLAFQMIQLY